MRCHCLLIVLVWTRLFLNCNRHFHLIDGQQISACGLRRKCEAFTSQSTSEFTRWFSAFVWTVLTDCESTMPIWVAITQNQWNDAKLLLFEEDLIFICSKDRRKKKCWMSKLGSFVTCLTFDPKIIFGTFTYVCTCYAMDLLTGSKVVH